MSFLFRKYCMAASMVVLLLLAIHNTGFTMNEESEKATLGGGCFWCTEAVYLQMKGVVSVVPGYSGGHVKNPSYKEVCQGTTGHAEVVQISFNPSEVSFAEILEVFFQLHDPTTLNRQGADAGTQYRSVIFYHSEEQKQTAIGIIGKLNAGKLFPKPVVTEISPYTQFYEAEEYHKNYFSRNPNQPYCRIVVAPKVQKFQKLFKDHLK
jgi:peptide-methionine (S)-S-oxide reductase